MHIDFSKTSLDMSIFLDYRSISQLLLGRQYLRSKKEYHFLDIGAGLGTSFISARKVFGNVSDSSKSYRGKLLYEFLKDLLVS